MNCVASSFDGMQTMILQANYHGDHPLFIVPWGTPRITIDQAPAFSVDHAGYAAYINEANFTVQHLTQDGKCCGHKQWHPSPYGHMIAADKMSYGLIKTVILPALENIKHALFSTKKIPKVNEMGRYMNTSVADSYEAYKKYLLPKMKCTSDYDKFGYCLPSLICHTSFEPKYPTFEGDYDLSTLIQGVETFPNKSQANFEGVRVSSSSMWQMAVRFPIFVITSFS